MKASEALILTQSANKLKHLEDVIKQAANRGEFEVACPVQLDSTDEAFLQSHGYKIDRREEKVHSGFGAGIDDDDVKTVKYISWRGR